MPYLNIETNVALDQNEKEGVMAESSKLLADLLQKPEGYVMISIRTGAHLMFGGTTDPCAYLEFKSLGLPESSTSVFSEAVTKLLGAKTGIHSNRIYIEFSAPERHMWGWNGGTF